MSSILNNTTSVASKPRAVATIDLGISDPTGEDPFKSTPIPRVKKALPLLTSTEQPETWDTTYGPIYQRLMDYPTIPGKQKYIAFAPSVGNPAP